MHRRGGRGCRWMRGVPREGCAQGRGCVQGRSVLQREGVGLWVLLDELMPQEVVDATGEGWCHGRGDARERLNAADGVCAAGGRCIGGSMCKGGVCAAGGCGCCWRGWMPQEVVNATGGGGCRERDVCKGGRGCVGGVCAREAYPERSRVQKASHTYKNLKLTVCHCDV